MIRRLVFAESTPRPSDQAGVEAVVQVRLEHEDPQRGLACQRAWPAVRTLADVEPGFSPRELPAFLEELLGYLRRRAGEAEAAGPRTPEALVPGAAREAQGLLRLEARLPAQVEAWLAHRAPRSHALLAAEFRLLTRSAVYVIEKRPPGSQPRLALAWRPAGEPAWVPLRCPLLSAADALSRGEVPELGAALPAGQGEPAALLLRSVIEARWLSRRLPPGLCWDAGTQTYSLRGVPAGPAASEHRIQSRPPSGELPPAPAAGRRPNPHNPPGLLVGLSLHVHGLLQPFELDIDPHDDLPLPVVERALAWLLGPAPESGSLYLDAQGRPPRD